MSRFSQLGNDLYSGRRSFDIVGRRSLWYLIAACLVTLSLVGLIGRGINLGLEFTGGSELRVTQAASTEDYEARSREIISELSPGASTAVTKIGADTIRIQTGDLTSPQAEEARSALAEEFEVPVEQVTSSIVGPSWGDTVTRKAAISLGVFLALVSVVLALYFRTWKMALAALVALIHDVLFTVGVYALLGIEVSPASVVGFLTILGYSIYDTIVVFDKVRENTEAAFATGRQTYAEAANQAVNQTIVRSINTSVVALIPVLVILIVGLTMIGPGTLLDLSWALFIGIAVGTFSSIFIAPPLLVHLREGEPEIRQHDARVLKRRERQGTRAARRAEPVPAGVAGPDATRAEGETSEPPAATPEQAVAPAAQQVSVQGRQLHPYAQRGPRNQPRRKRR